MRSDHRLFGALLLLQAPVMASGCGDFELQSTWRQREIVVDGEAGDWAGAMVYSDKAQADVGIVNDEKNLYICLIPREMSVQNQIMMRGLTLWFDVAGGEAKTFGVRFPLGLLDSRSMESLRPSMSGGGIVDRIQMIEEFERSLTHMVVLAEDTTRISLAEAQGIEVRAGVSTANSLIYEIRVPLRSMDGRSLGASPGGVLGIGLETPDIDRQALRQRAAGVGGRGGMPGGGGIPGSDPGGMSMGGRSGMRGGRGGARPEIPEPLQAWGKLRLATQSDRVRS